MFKKNLLAVSVLLLTLASFSGSAFSQQDQAYTKTPEQMATKIADKMKQNLSLSDDQYKQVYNLALTKAQDRFNNKEKYKSMDKEARKQLMKQNKEGFRKQLEGILNKDQIEKFHQMHKQKGNRAHLKGSRKQKRAE